MAKQKDFSFDGIAWLADQRRNAEAGQQPDDTAFREKYPAMFSLLANNRISEKEWTDPASLTIQNASGEWKIGLSVPGLGAYCSILSPTIDQGLAELEAQLFSRTIKFSYNLKRKKHIRKFDKSNDDG